VVDGEWVSCERYASDEEKGHRVEAVAFFVFARNVADNPTVFAE
jgi:hypothetical protein